MVDHNKIVTLASYTKDEIGQTEENVKINFMVPLLEAFGHTRYEFEYKYKDIIIQKGVHKNCKVIVETKSYDKKLEGELGQLKRYCDEERPLLGLIANGLELKIYSHFWRRTSFEDTLLFLIKREQLAENKIIEGLNNILSKEALTSGSAHQFVDQREKEIEAAEETIKSLQDKSFHEIELVKNKISELETQSEIIKKQIEEFNSGINTIAGNTLKRISEIWDSLGFKQSDAVVGPRHSEKKQESNKNNTQPIITDKFDPLEQIMLTIKPSDVKYGIIQFSKDQRSFFPGYDADFILETENYGEFKVHVTSGEKGINKGNLEEGKYLTGRLQSLYNSRGCLKEGNVIIIEMIEKNHRYKLRQI